MSSKRAQRRKSARLCGTKRAFPDEASASRSAARLEARLFSQGSDRLHAYRCPANGSHWHVGHTPGQKGLEKRRAS